MKIGIDARFALRKRRGIGNYVLNLIRNLGEIDRTNRYILYVDCDDVENILPVQKNFTTKKLLLSNYFIWEQLILPMQAKKDNLDILHCTGNTAPIRMGKKIKLIITIHDVMYLKDYSELPRSPSMYQRCGRIYRKTIVPRAVRNVFKVITVSRFSKNDVIKHLTEVGEDRISVVHEAVDEMFCVLEKNDAVVETKDKAEVSEDYILTLGGTDLRKNTQLVIEAYLKLKEESKISEKLVIVGIPNWQKTQFCKVVQESPYRKDIIVTDFITKDDLVLLYNNATVFLYPSLYEGFGLPVLEAMSCGVPVITSNATAIPEVAGDAAFLMETLDVDTMKETIATVLENYQLRQNLIEKGFKQVKNFSWRKTATQTLKIYESAFVEASE